MIIHVCERKTRFNKQRKPRASDDARVKEGPNSDGERVDSTIVDVVYERKARGSCNESNEFRRCKSERGVKFKRSESRFDDSRS